MGRINKPNKTTPASADTVLIYDSEDSSDDKSITLGQIATLTESQDTTVTGTKIFADGVQFNGDCNFGHNVNIAEDLGVTGDVTASSFIGDGSELTGTDKIAFTLNSGNVDSNGNADLLTGTTSTTLTFKVDSGTTYKPLQVTYADGGQEVLTSLASITGLSTNGSYTILKEKGSNPIAVLSTTVTQGKTFEASPTDGDYHCLTATGLQTYKRVAGAWVETQYVSLGTVTVAGRIISAVSTQGYNRNGFDTAEAGFPSGKYIDLTLGASGSRYIAPADGYYSVAIQAGVTNLVVLGFTNITAGDLCTNVFSVGLAAATLYSHIECKKGDNVLLEYSVVGAISHFRFHYAEGSKP